MVPITGEAFETKSKTEIYWLGNTGALIYSRTACKALVPVVSEFHATRYVASLLETELNVARDTIANQECIITQTPPHQ